MPKSSTWAVRATGGIGSHPAKGNNPSAQVKTHEWNTSSIAAVYISLLLPLEELVLPKHSQFYLSQLLPQHFFHNPQFVDVTKKIGSKLISEI